MTVQAQQSVLLKAQQSGFTLLELLLVVTILSSTAMVAMMTFEATTSQHRIEENEQRLQLLKRATIQTLNYDYNHDGIIDRTQLKGYVVDNGRLPPCVSGLMPETDEGTSKYVDDCNDDTDGSDSGGSDMDNFGLKSPIYDPVPTSDFNDGSADQIELDQDNEQLWKGFRPVYLSNLVRDEFRDSWGTRNADATEDSHNWGWEYDLDEDAGTLGLVSLGRDGVESNSTNYPAGIAESDRDLRLDVNLAEWAQEYNYDADADGTYDRVKITINISNNSVDDVVVPSSNYSLVLLEFVNGEDREFWRQSDAGKLNRVSDGSKNYPAGDDYVDEGPGFEDYSDTLKNGGSIQLELELDHHLAVGEHILMLVAHDGTGLTNTTPPCLDIDESNSKQGDGACLPDDDTDPANDDGTASNYDDDGTDADDKADRLTKKFTVLPDGLMYTADNPSPTPYTINWEIN